jgi:hypothetical protein
VGSQFVVMKEDSNFSFFAGDIVESTILKKSDILISY